MCLASNSSFTWLFSSRGDRVRVQRQRWGRWKPWRRQRIQVTGIRPQGPCSHRRSLLAITFLRCPLLVVSSILNVPGESTLRRDFQRLQQENKERSEAHKRQQAQLAAQRRDPEEHKRQLLHDRQKRIEEQKEQRRRLEEVLVSRYCNITARVLLCLFIRWWNHSGRFSHVIIKIMSLFYIRRTFLHIISRAILRSDAEDWHVWHATVSVRVIYRAALDTFFHDFPMSYNNGIYHIHIISIAKLCLTLRWMFWNFILDESLLKSENYK